MSRMITIEIPIVVAKQYASTVVHGPSPVGSACRKALARLAPPRPTLDQLRIARRDNDGGAGKGGFYSNSVLSVVDYCEYLMDREDQMIPTRHGESNE